MGNRSVAGTLSGAAAALAEVFIGISGLVGPRRVIGLDGSSTLAIAADQTALEARLSERDFSLDQQRQVEGLLQDFTRGQMTRHYWGSFAESLVELGLSPMEQAKTMVRSDDRSTGFGSSQGVERRLIWLLSNVARTASSPGIAKAIASRF